MGKEPEEGGESWQATVQVKPHEQRKEGGRGGQETLQTEVQF